MVEVKNIRKGENYSFHLVIVCDETGIFNAFIFLKDMLSDNGKVFISFIYTVSDKNPQPLFKNELSILEKRYSACLLIFIVEIETRKDFFKQEILEAIINSNTLPEMRFSIFGQDAFVNHLSELVRFISAKPYSIEIKIV
jgi:hypothetical protein